MWGMLGDVIFELLKTPSSLKTTKRARLPSLVPIEGKTIHQFTGTEPQEIELNIHFHASFCNPEAEAQKLKNLIGTPQVLVIGEKILGEYAIEEIEEEIKTTAQGKTLSIKMKLRLKEV